jgi:thiosulfate dehydrogenase (quinone) large subunit
MATPTAPVASPAEISPSATSDHRPRSLYRPSPPALAVSSVDGHPLGSLALILLRLALGAEFLWAFVDKLFGLGYSTTSARAWLNGGSPTKGFLTGVSSGPLRGFFNGIAGAAWADWLFMIALVGIGTGLALGVALRPVAASGVLLLALMWLATWPPASLAGGQLTGSTNPVVDDHVISALALIVVAAFAAPAAWSLRRRWARMPLVQRCTWLA